MTSIILPLDVRQDGIVPSTLLREIMRRSDDEKLKARLAAQRALVSRILQDTAHQPIDPRAPGLALREIWDAKDQEDRVGVKIRGENDPAIGDRDADDAFTHTGIVREFYRSVHGRNSIDGNGMNLVSVVHFGQKFNNAFWSNRRMTYGRGDQVIFARFVLLDVTGHEMTHGVTEFESGAIYWGQSGALNEHYSDVFGKLVEIWSKKSSTDLIDWLIGRGIFTAQVHGDGLRNMLKPGTAYDDPKLGRDRQPAHMKNYIVTRSDNGGVHSNSGIPNGVFAQFVMEVGGWAWEAPGQIWFAARKKAGSNPSFASFAFYTLEAARELGYTQHVDKLLDSWRHAGVEPNQNAVDELTPSRWVIGDEE